MLRSWKVIFATIISCFVSITQVQAQYKKMGVQSGTQVFDNNSVNVTYLGSTPTFTGQYFCGYGPYHIGYLNLVFFIIYTPVSYTFTFNRPVTHVRIDAGGLWSTSIVSVDINGAPYTLTNTNLINSPNECNWEPAIITGGNLTAPPGTPPPGARVYYAGRLDINEPTGITSATVAYAAPLNGTGQSGANFSFYFGEIEASNSGPVCIGTSVQLYGDYSITEPGTFSWSGPNGFTSTEQHPVIPSLTPLDTGVYTLTYSDGVNTFSDTTHVTFLPGPELPLITVDSPVCSGSALRLSATATAGATYNWTGPNGFTAAGPTVDIADIQRTQEGVYRVTAHLHSCSPSASTKVNVLQTIKHRFTEIACSSDGYDFNGKMLFTGGTYTDTFSANNGCDSFSILSLVMLPSPETGIDMGEAAPLCLGDTILLHSTGNAQSYTWYNESGYYLGAGNQLAFPLLDLSPTLLITGVATNTCKDTARLTIPVSACCQVILPNAFSPNNDGINDNFGPVAKGMMKECQLQVYNRWGEQIFIGSSIDRRWDGTIGGMPVDMGTYYYYMHATCIDGAVVKKQGEVVLIR